MPAVSVIIPVFNRAAMLGRTLATVAEQTFRDFEVVIVDDASSDDPAPAIEAARAGGLDINYIKFLKNRGVSAARNAGIEAATGDFIAFLDSDDLWMPEKLQRQVDFALTLPDREAVFCLTRTRVRDETGGETIRPAADPDGDLSEFLFVHNGFAQCSSFFVSRGIAASVKFDETLRQYEDYLFYLAAGRAAGGAHYLPDSLVIWHDDARADRLGRADNRERAERFLAAARDLVTPRARRAFALKTFARENWKDNPFKALVEIVAAPMAGAIPFSQVPALIARSALPPSYYQAIRRRASDGRAK